MRCLVRECMNGELTLTSTYLEATPTMMGKDDVV